MIVTKIISIYLLIALLRYVYTVCIGFLYVHPKKNTTKNYQPLVSIIIPAWNEEIGVSKTIESVVDNKYKNTEVIVVNDGSTDDTARVVHDLKENYLGKVYLINQENGGKASALNHGIQSSRGEVVITIDADSYIMPDAIQYLIDGLSDPYYDISIGKIVVGNTRTLVGLIQFFEYIFGFHSKKSQYLNNAVYILPGALTAFRKKVVEDVGYFEDYSKTEDFDISMKLKAKGYKIVYVDKAECVTEGASDFTGLINQRTRWRHGFLQCLLYRKDYLLNTKKGKYLTFIEFPLALVGVADILLFPVFLFFIIWQTILYANPFIFILFYLILPFCYVLLMEDEIISNPTYRKYFLFLPILFTIVNVVEYIALIKSIYRLTTNKETKWTNWTRVGANN